MALMLALLAAAYSLAAEPEKLVKVELDYHAPGSGSKPDFSPYGTQVKLVDLPADAPLPEGADRPAKTGVLPVGPNEQSWIKILVTADIDHTVDICRVYIDTNRNGIFGDDGPAMTAIPTQNAKTKAWWSSFNGAELPVSYGENTEPYMINLWAVREHEDMPVIIRYSVASWRSGSVWVDGVKAFVAMMDADNNAVYNAKDKWSVIPAFGEAAVMRVLSSREARPTNPFMFLDNGAGKEAVLEFRDVTPDGRLMTFAVVDRAVTKVQDRAPDDTLAADRARPRTLTPFHWSDKGFEQSVAEAKASGRRLIVDFRTSWCGPCHEMDNWIWTDAEVASVLSAGYVGIKLDGDLEKQLVERFHVVGYPTILVLDPSGAEIQRANYLDSKNMVRVLKQ